MTAITTDDQDFLLTFTDPSGPASPILVRNPAMKRPKKNVSTKKVGGFLTWKILKSHKCCCLLSQLYKSISFNHYWLVFKSSFQVGSDSRTEEAPTQIDLLPQVSLQVGNRRLILLMKEVLHHLGCIKPCE